MNVEAGNLLVETSFLPSWGFVRPLRTFVKELLETICVDDAHVADAVTTLHELVENAVKYGRGTVHLDVRLDTKGFVSSIAVGSRTTPERRRVVIERLNELSNAQNPTTYYLARMADSAMAGGGGLGLARVRAECAMHLSWRESADALVIVAQPMATGERR